LYNKSFGEEMIPIDFRKKYEFMTNIAWIVLIYRAFKFFLWPGKIEVIFHESFLWEYNTWLSLVPEKDSYFLIFLITIFLWI
jgi:hypothetical protein